jgi:glycine cleavage system transcriptional repressor
MDNWYMVAVVGRDQPGIVARLTGCLFESGCQLGEASMVRLGNSFTVMMMVHHGGDKQSLQDILSPVVSALGLQLHLDNIEGGLHQHVDSNVRISVAGADRPGIVASVTARLSESGFNICNLETDVGGTEQHPIYIMHIEGTTTVDADALQTTLDQLTPEDIDIHVAEIDTVMG